MRYVSWQLLLFRPIALRPFKALHVHAVGGYLLRHRQDLADQPVIQRVRHGVLCSRYARETLIGFPLRVQLSACRRPLLQRKSAHQKGAARRGGHFVGILRSWQGARNPRIPQGRECVQGKPWSGFPCTFGYPPAGDRFCSAKARTKKGRPAGADIFGAGMGTRTPTREHENLRGMSP